LIEGKLIRMPVPNRFSPSLGRSALLCSCIIACGPVSAANETTLLWGDTHVHTSNSVDAWAYGNFTIDPDAAYRFARGLPVLHPATRQRIHIDRPLDFLVVADHAEMLQLQARMAQGDAAWLSKASAEGLLGLEDENPRSVFGEVTRIVTGGRQDILADFHRPELLGQTWADQVDAAELHNKPGTFTALIGWEWSPGPDGANLHRVIFTAADGDTAKQFAPLSYYDTTRPEELWQWLADTSARTGADFVAIPHNSNMSDGRMFDMTDSDGRPITAEYARTRMQWEPVMEISQTKGTSETTPELSPDDAFADFEVRNVLLSGAVTPITGGSYARTGLLRGLGISSSTGGNPYKFGFIGSTDTHTGLVSVDESNHHGKLAVDSLPEERLNPTPGGFDPWRTSASGLAAVWAGENTRAEILEAFKRREVYGTSGTRILLRFFGGFAFTADDAGHADIAGTGYSKGVPMGGDLAHAPAGTAPAFLVEAIKDPQSAGLDRIQIVKGWTTADGQTHEQVFDVAWDDARKLDGMGRLPALPSTVDADTASWDRSAGSTRLVTVWRDPGFDPEQLAFYYARVLEIETPRHQVYDAVALRMNPEDTGWPLELQERAWSSPIWYTP
jgi:hypothetical protein